MNESAKRFTKTDLRCLYGKDNEVVSRRNELTIFFNGITKWAIQSTLFDYGEESES